MVYSAVHNRPSLIMLSRTAEFTLCISTISTRKGIWLSSSAQDRRTSNSRETGFAPASRAISISEKLLAVPVAREPKSHVFTFRPSRTRRVIRLVSCIARFSASLSVIRKQPWSPIEFPYSGNWENGAKDNVIFRTSGFVRARVWRRFFCGGAFFHLRRPLRRGRSCNCTGSSRNMSRTNRRTWTY